MKRFTVLLAALVLAGCGALPSAGPVAPIFPKMSGNVRTVCELLPEPPAHRPGGVPMGEQSVYLDEVIGMYVECAVRDHAKRAWIESVNPAASAQR